VNAFPAPFEVAGRFSTAETITAGALARDQLFRSTTPRPAGISHREIASNNDHGVRNREVNSDGPGRGNPDGAVSGAYGETYSDRYLRV
jgi:hypothetical protein